MNHSSLARFSLSPAIAQAITGSTGVVALESTVIAHGLPAPHNLVLARDCETIVREQGAEPATIGIIAGRSVIGLDEAQLQEMASRQDVAKVNLSNLAQTLTEKKWGATTVAASLCLAHRAGLQIFATGGIGGVHRGASSSFDISADLTALARFPVITVCAGAKAILDLPKTMEMLETLGVPVVGYQIDEVEAAQEKLQNALVEHRRQVERSGGNVRVNQTELQAAQSLIAKTMTELENVRKQQETMRQREQVLLTKQNSVLLTAPRKGVVLGEKLLELNGKYLEKGAEICRIADPSQLRVRIQVPEREIGDVKEDAPVRLKTRAWPDRIFAGRVEKIGGEAEPDENKQMTYRVELIVDNKDGALKPGMTAFARISFGRRAIGWILWHKVKQALRPELWLF